MAKLTALQALALAAISFAAFRCSALSQPEPYVPAAPQLPPDVPISKGAGRGGHLTVMLHLESGSEFPCVLDTGSPGILLPESLEPKLGKRLGTRTIRTLGGPKETEHIYAAPKLYLGDTLLNVAKTIGTWHSSSGVLGMDCLRHYCIQFDFQAGKIRFLDSEHLDPSGLGKSFPLTSTRYAHIRHPALLGQKPTALLLDTGFPFDGMLDAKVFKRAILRLPSQPVPLMKDGVRAGEVPGMACFSTSIWDDLTYTNLVIQAGRPELLGLKFLARHKVTFNFPKRVMYLLPTSAEPLAPKASP